jgi:hypothetical protein
VLDVSAGDAHMTGQVGPTSACAIPIYRTLEGCHARHSTGEIAEALIGLRLVGAISRPNFRLPYLTGIFPFFFSGNSRLLSLAAWHPCSVQANAYAILASETSEPIIYSACALELPAIAMWDYQRAYYC